MSFHTYITSCFIIQTKLPTKQNKPVQDVFITYIDELMEHNENLESSITAIFLQNVLTKNKNKLKYPILKQRYDDMIILTTGYNQISYKSNN